MGNNIGNSTWVRMGLRFCFAFLFWISPKIDVLYQTSQFDKYFCTLMSSLQFYFFYANPTLRSGDIARQSLRLTCNLKCKMQVILIYWYKSQKVHSRNNQPLLSVEVWNHASLDNYLKILFGFLFLIRLWFPNYELNHNVKR